METGGHQTNVGSLALRGVAAILFGAMTLVVPDVAVDTLVLLFGAYVLFEGVCHVAEGVRNRSEHRAWGLSLFRGLLSVAAGIVTFALPSPTELALLGVIGGWALVSGIAETLAGMRLGRGGAPCLLDGALSITFGILTILIPDVGAVSLVWLIGAYASGLGVLVLVAALWLRRPSTSQTATVVTIRGVVLAPATARSR